MPAHFKELPGLRLNAFARVDDHDDRVHGRKDAIGVLGEILVTRSVEQVDAKTAVVELQDGGTDGNATFTFEFHPIGGGSALIFARRNGTSQLHRATVQEQLFRESGFTRVRMRNNGESAPFLDLCPNIQGRQK